LHVHSPPSSAARRAVRLITVGAAVLLTVVATSLPGAAAGPYRQEPVSSAVDTYLSSVLNESAIPGAAVAVTRGDRVLLVRGYGVDSQDTPVTEESLFRIASLSKSFTALAVMQLVDAGLLDLDDPVQEHLPEFQLADPRAGQITVRHLLNHTSGLTDAQVPEVSRPQPSTPTEATTSLRSARLASTPGRSYSYHNPNYHVAARLVEVLSHEPFSQYLRRHIFEPAGMTSTTSTVTDDQPVPGLADGHVVAYGHAIPVSGLGGFTVGDGGIVSTAADMARWLTVNANGGRAADGTRIVSARGMRLLHTPSSPQVKYALGWDTDGAEAPRRLEHSGTLHTFSAEEALWPGSGYGVVLLFNAGSPMLMDQNAIVHGVFDIVEGTTQPAEGPGLAERLDTTLALLTIITLGLGACGVVRAGRWARRRHGSPLVAALRLTPIVILLAVGAAFPRLLELWIGRDLTWRAAAYGWPALVLFMAAVLAATGATLLARSWQLLNRTDAAPPPGPPSRGGPALSPSAKTRHSAQGAT